MSLLIYKQPRAHLYEAMADNKKINIKNGRVPVDILV